MFSDLGGGTDGLTGSLGLEVIVDDQEEEVYLVVETELEVLFLLKEDHVGGRTALGWTAVLDGESALILLEGEEEEETGEGESGEARETRRDSEQGESEEAEGESEHI